MISLYKETNNETLLLNTSGTLWSTPDLCHKVELFKIRCPPCMYLVDVLLVFEMLEQLIVRIEYEVTSHKISLKSSKN